MADIRGPRLKGTAELLNGSALSDQAVPLQGAYCAGKHALKGWLESLRVELILHLVYGAALGWLVDREYVWFSQS